METKAIPYSMSIIVKKHLDLLGEASSTWIAL
jgi:hypothetical protein